MLQLMPTPQEIVVRSAVEQIAAFAASACKSTSLASRSCPRRAIHSWSRISLG